MGGIWLRARAQMRQARASTLVLTLVVAVAGGLVLAAVAGATRTREALPSFVEAFRSEDLLVYRDGTLAEQTDLIAEVAAVLGVAAATGDAFTVFASTDDAGDPVVDRAATIGAVMAINDGLLHEIEVPLVLEGRLSVSDDPEEIVVNEAVAEARDLAPGDDLDVVAFRPDQLEAVANDRRVVAAGPAFRLRVVGVIRQPQDISIRSSFEGNEAFMMLTPAFWAAHHDEVASYGVEGLIRLEPEADAEVVEQAITDQVGDVLIERSQATLATVNATQRAIELQAGALLAAGIAFAAVAAVFVGQVVARRVSPTAAEEAVLRALGWHGRQLAATATLRALPIAVGGAIGAAALAFALSPLTPFGTARRAVVEPGMVADVAVLVCGGLAVTGLVLLVAAVSGRRSAERAPRRGRERRARVAANLAGAGAPPPLTVALALPLDPRRRAMTVTAVIAATVGVAAVAAGALVHAELADLVDQPARWGQQWDVTVGTYGDPESAAEGVAPLRENPAVGAFAASSSAEFSGDTLELDGRVIGAIGLETLGGEPFVPAMLSGRPPTADDEVALGRRTLAAAGAEVGDEVVLSVPDGGSVRARVTGEVIVPALLAPDARLGDGAVMTMTGLDALRPGNDFAALYLVRFADGVRSEEGIDSLRPAFGDTIVAASRPADVESLARVEGLPWLIGALLASLAAVAVVNALFLAARRQARDLAVLKALGFARRDVRRVGLVQAGLFTILATALGVPIGVLLGRQVWLLVGHTIGLDFVPSIPAIVLVVIPLALVAGLLLAAVPAERAARANAVAALHAD